MGGADGDGGARAEQGVDQRLRRAPLPLSTVPPPRHPIPHPAHSLLLTSSLLQPAQGSLASQLCRPRRKRQIPLPYSNIFVDLKLASAKGRKTKARRVFQLTGEKVNVSVAQLINITAQSSVTTVLDVFFNLTVESPLVCAPPRPFVWPLVKGFCSTRTW